MNKFISSQIILILFLFILSCKEEPTKPPTETNLTLEVLDKSCTEVWIDIKANDQANKLGSVYLNDEFRTQFYLKDTLVYLDELLPNKTYSIKLTNQDGIGTQTEFTTMDTTSHNFTWETFEFGGGSSSILSDVAIINENDIWAVGEIYTKDTYTYDSNGVWQQPYNAVHWNGSKWELKRMLRVGVNNVSKINTVYAFGENDVWFDGLLKWNGEELTLHSNNFPLSSNGTGWRINSMWGESSNNFYVVGNGGNIAHYNGSSWSKIVSGTNLDIQDIYGSLNPKTNNYEIIAIASNNFQNNGLEVLSIKNSTSTKLSTANLSSDISGIWFMPKRKYFITGGGIFKKNDIYDSKSWYKYPSNSFYTYYTNSIDGTDYNHIVTSGSYGEILHFNGSTWYNYRSMLNVSSMDIIRIRTHGNNLMVGIGNTGYKVTIIKAIK